SIIFFFSSRRRHTRFSRDWSSDVCSSDLGLEIRQDDMGGGQLMKRGDIRRLSLLDFLAEGRRGMTGVAQRAGLIGRLPPEIQRQIGRASCRERVEVGGGAGALGKVERYSK